MSGVGKAIRSGRALAVGVALLVPSGVHAFCQATTTLNDGRCPPLPCPTDGDRLSWGTPQIEYAFHEGAFEGIDESSVRAAIGRAFAHWSRVRCDGRPVGLEFAEVASTTPLTVGPDSREPNLNVVSMLDATSWRDLGFDAHVFAKTSLWFDRDTGEIVGSDIAFNRSIGTFGVCPDTGCPPGLIDLENVATHEIGHFLGLAHSADAASTMWCDAVKGDLEKRTLGADDEAGLCAIYGAGFLDPGAPPTAESPAPADASAGGCALTEPSSLPTPWLLLCGWLFLSRRHKHVGVPQPELLVRRA